MKKAVTQTKQNVKATIKDTKKLMTKVGGKVAVAYTSFKEGGYKELLSVGLDFIPIVGNAKALVEAAIGRDPITGRKLETWERGASVAAILGGPLVKGVKHAGKAVAGIVASGSKAKNKTVNLAKSPTPTNPPKQQAPAPPAKTKDQGTGSSEKVTKPGYIQREIEVEFTRRNPKHDSKEFARQLKDQEEGINELTVDEFIKNRDRYLKDGGAIEGDAVQKLARKKALQNKVDELRRDGLSYEEAEKKANEWIKGQAALHNPDQIAGGNPTKIGGLGDKDINSSIGSQWRSRIKDLDKQVRAIGNNMTEEERNTTYLNIKLKH